MVYLSEKELKKYGTTWSLSRQAVALVNHQKANWKTAGDHYRSLREIRNRHFAFPHFRIICQYNPARMRSTGADLSAEAIRSRPCFLCETNLPQEQCALPFHNDFAILANPYPVFPFHLTIPSLQHLPQELHGHERRMLQLAQSLQEFTVLYNGPRCGASAPDHLHFQAGIKDILPAEEEISRLKDHHSLQLVRKGKLSVYALRNYLRPVILFESTDEEQLADAIHAVMSMLPTRGGEEPMVNILSWYHEGRWVVLLFPRSQQRPSCYYAEEPGRIMVSPAALELGGLLVIPREEDFCKITREDISRIFREVTPGEAESILLEQQISVFPFPERDDHINQIP